MNYINADQRAKQIEERLKKAPTSRLSAEDITKSTISPEERRRRREEILTREKGFVTESNANYTITRAAAPKNAANIISATYTPSINASDRAAQIRKQRELDYAKGR